MAFQISTLKYDKNRSEEDNLKEIVKYVNNLATTLTYTLNNLSADDVVTASGTSLQDLYAVGALKGEPGKDGSNGLSAYQIAVKNGFKGTEKEWLDSLKGADGVGVPAGGTTGQVLAKLSDNDYDTAWITLE